MTTTGYLGLLAAVCLMRLLELLLSRRNQRRLALRGAVQVRHGELLWMVVVHVGVLAGAVLELLLLDRPWVPALGVPMLVLFTAAVGLRWWVIGTLAGHWNVAVVASTSLGVVTRGPYRFVRHPNYTALFVELLALPLIHTAWITALAGAALHAVALHRRVVVEERVLMADPAYRSAMGHKPRFVPGLF